MLIKRLLAGTVFASTAVFAVAMNAIGVENQTQELTVPFARGDAPGIGYQASIDQAISFLNANSNYVAVLKGHTGTRGPASSNLTLSETRAQRVAKDLQDLGIDNSRIFVYAKGEDQPLEQLDGESDNVFQSRLNRVEIYILHYALDQETVL